MPNLNMETNKTLAAALAWARVVPVFPCRPDKRPYTAHGFKDATHDRAQIERWWEQWPEALIGMPTGERSGIAVLDLDVKKGKDGRLAVPDWESLSNVITRTQSGGLHLWFHDDQTLRCSTDELALGVDVRAEGGYVIVPPSPGYSWLKDGKFWEMPFWPDKYRPVKKRQEPRPGSDPLAEPEKVAAALRDIPNRDVGWDDWKYIMLAAWRATGGSEAGFTAFDAWSKKSNKYDGDETRKQWDAIPSSPPDSIGAGTLIHLAAEARRKALPVGDALPTIKHGDPIPPMSWLIRNRIPETGAGLLIGQWGCYKTFLFLDIAGSVMTGRDWTGEQVYRRGGVLMFAPEGSGGIGMRVAALAEHRIAPFGDAPFDLKQMPIEWTASAPMLVGSGKNDSLPTLIATAAAADARFKRDYGVSLALIGIDTIAACAGWKDENDNAEASRVMAVLRDLSLAAGCAVMGIAHAGKNAELGARGASALEANSDFILLAMGEKTLTGEVNNTQVALRKLRDGPQGSEFPYLAKIVDMGNDQRGNPVTSRIIDWAGVPKRSKPALSSSAQAFDDALGAALRGHGTEVAINGVDRYAVTRDQVREAFRLVWKPETGLKRTALDERFRKALLEARAGYRIDQAEVDKIEWIWRVPSM